MATVRATLLLVWLALVLAACRPIPTPVTTTGAPGVGDPIFPLLGNGGYDVQHYTLDLTVDAARNLLKGTAAVRAVATQPLAAFNLDLSGLEVSAVTIDDTPALFARNGHELTITPAVPIAADAIFTATIAYAGEPTPLSDPDLAFIDQGWNHQDETIFVVSEPGGAMTWYPVNNHPTDKATYTLRITVDEPNVVAANGVLAEEIDLGEQRTYVWEMAQPMASYLTTLVIGDFVRVEEPGPDGVLIRHYFPPAEAETLSEVFANTDEMVAFYGDLIAPYPFEEYGIVMLPFPLGFALETQTLSVFGPEMAMEGVNAHELAHQWFGNTVTLAAWDQTWLNEGFATYLQRLWMEDKLGSDFMDGGMRQYYAWLKAFQVEPPGSVTEADLFSEAVYERGAWVLHALRLKIGDELFREFLRTYYARYKDGVVTTADFIATASEVSGQDLTEFLNAWLYAEEMPPIPE
ncbi:MAG TPA: M1 family metallopeptidase [Chloroflexi bacterium]|nr:M1 family metallopeptidase [Chloroflexota bacterium]